MDETVRLQAFVTDPWRQSVDIYIKRVLIDDGKFHSKYGAVDIEFREVAEGKPYPRTPLVISNTAAQDLMDSLWECGFRPSEGTGSAGALRATEKHLEDMRRLVFGKLDAEE